MTTGAPAHQHDLEDLSNAEWKRRMRERDDRLTDEDHRRNRLDRDVERRRRVRLRDDRIVRNIREAASLLPGRSRESHARQAGHRRTGASSRTSSADPGDDGSSEPPAGRRSLTRSEAAAG